MFRPSHFRRALLVALIPLALAAGSAVAADHRDSAIARMDPRVDINDVYAFRPDGSDNLVVIMTVNPYRGAMPNPLFADDARYEIHVSNTPSGAPDEIADAVVRVTFSGGANPQTFRVEGLTAEAITGTVGQTTSTGGVKVHCGAFDDPFFFDLDAFLTFVTSPYVPAAGYRAAGAGSPVNAFAGANVAAIVVELPISALTSPATGVIKAWAKTFRKVSQ